MALLDDGCVGDAALALLPKAKDAKNGVKQFLCQTAGAEEEKQEDGGENADDDSGNRTAGESIVLCCGGNTRDSGAVRTDGGLERDCCRSGAGKYDCCGCSTGRADERRASGYGRDKTIPIRRATANGLTLSCVGAKLSLGAAQRTAARTLTEICVAD